ncbi:Oidioi.mRNA.OKI2018_I69.XSR.g16438.t1.cds [Oikopleura dioica]|uniref:Oidioi.mRNA.OKI2018_I69.XSR.g16438.t1.cds n=1 Tax=Oikopleura dioica TaxID=34765 RepID=A0ABN7SG36_OIKDI|nr:Oidioi.mRNA.OKI2018_I69.XSR.g16438.t1.cds [Oikopleura dioica]
MDIVNLYFHLRSSCFYRNLYGLAGAGMMILLPMVFCICHSGGFFHTLFAVFKLVLEPIKLTIRCLKLYLEYLDRKNLADSEEGTREDAVVSADFAILYHKLYMVLIEDSIQVILGCGYLADASRWYYEPQSENSSIEIKDCTQSALQNINHDQFDYSQWMPFASVCRQDWVHFFKSIRNLFIY